MGTCNGYLKNLEKHWKNNKIRFGNQHPVWEPATGTSKTLEKHWKNNKILVPVNPGPRGPPTGPPRDPPRNPWEPLQNHWKNNRFARDLRYLPGVATGLAWRGPKPATGTSKTFKKHWKNNNSLVGKPGAPAEGFGGALPGRARSHENY